MTIPTQTSDRVLIVGAGPTGLTAAVFLAQQNVDVDIIDPRSGPVNDSRALGVHARTLEFMAMLGIDDAFVAQGHQTRYMTFHRGARNLFRLDFNAIAEQTRYPYMLVLPQSQSERILVRRLGDLGQPIGLADPPDRVQPGRRQRVGDTRITQRRGGSAQLCLRDRL